MRSQLRSLTNRNSVGFYCVLGAVVVSERSLLAAQVTATAVPMIIVVVAVLGTVSPMSCGLMAVIALPSPLKNSLRNGTSKKNKQAATVAEMRVSIRITSHSSMPSAIMKGWSHRESMRVTPRMIEPVINQVQRDWLESVSMTCTGTIPITGALLAEVEWGTRPRTLSSGLWIA